MHDWNTVEQYFRKSFAGSRYEDNAKGLADLITQLRSNVHFTDVIPGVSLVRLTLERPQNPTSISIWCECPGKQYEVCFYTGGHLHDCLTVIDRKILETLIAYLTKLSAEN